MNATRIKAGWKNRCWNSSKPALRRSTDARGASTCTPRTRARGETEQRLYLLSVWREAPCYTERERAALNWTETLTQLSSTQDAPDEVYEQARAQFSEKELVDLTLAIIAINGWNRLNVAFRTTIGEYVSPYAKAK